MARGALGDVLFLLAATVVYELRRDACGLSGDERCRRKLVTAIAISGDWLLRFPVTIETRTMIGGRGFERRGARAVTDGAVVVILRRVRETQHRDRVLVFVVRKLDREL